jgi:glucose-6-phosphate-specific signal transduction histidine kinase
MAGIAQKVELFNLAYNLAWKYVSEDQKLRQPNLARRLHDSIGRQIKEGATEPAFIASEALKDVGI